MFIKTFKNISKKDTAVAGGKGASLGEMAGAKIPVPPGFVVLSTAFDKFLKDSDVNIEIDAMWDRLDIRSIDEIEANSEMIQKIIVGKEFPKDLAKEILKGFDALGAQYVAVRSSATAEDSSADAWAGQLESYLYVARKNLLQSVQKCWASLFTPRAIFYRVERELQKKNVLVAVVVQKMVNSEVAGVCFTVHPVTRDPDQMIIEAGWGLGEAIVQGIITPDSYVVEKSKIKNQKSKFIIDININKQEKQIIKGRELTGEKPVPAAKREKQKLSEKQIKELAKICIGIEKHYGFPCDIEWALEKGKFFITQSRPITTLR